MGSSQQVAMDYSLIKRLMDIVGSTAGLVVFSPIIVIVATLVKLSSEGPVFADIPERIGLNKKPFKMYKFRSMIINAHDVLRSDPKYKKLYEQYKKGNFKVDTNKDPRITKVGKFIRKTSLDEIPQLINILKGNMSLVGPRAFHLDEIQEQKKRYPGTGKWVSTLLKVKPGLTGPWQVSGRSSIDFPERVRIDAEYAKNKSLLLDVKIVLKTIPALLRGEGN